jgi:hypothetical protein
LTTIVLLLNIYVLEEGTTMRKLSKLLIILSFLPSIGFAHFYGGGFGYNTFGYGNKLVICNYTHHELFYRVGFANWGNRFYCLRRNYCTALHYTFPGYATCPSVSISFDHRFVTVPITSGREKICVFRNGVRVFSF